MPKKQYKKKNVNRPRLCADDVMERKKLIEYQDRYAEAMAKYGLQRGIRGSEARHISTQQYYRDLITKNVDLEKCIEQKEAELKETEQALSRMKNELKTEKLKSSVADVGSTIIDGISSMVGTSKVKKQKLEIDGLQSYNECLSQKIKQLEQDKIGIRQEYKTEIDKRDAELCKIHNLFPKIKEFLRIPNLCKHLGFSDVLIKLILEMRPVGFKGKLYSAEYKRDFQTDFSEAEIKSHPTEKGKLQLTIDGVNDTNWFRQKYRKFEESIGVKLR